LLRDNKKLSIITISASKRLRYTPNKTVTRHALAGFMSVKIECFGNAALKSVQDHLPVVHSSSSQIHQEFLNE